MKIGSLVRFDPPLYKGGGKHGELYVVVATRQTEGDEYDNWVRCVSAKTGWKSPFVRTSRLSVYA